MKKRLIVLSLLGLLTLAGCSKIETTDVTVEAGQELSLNAEEILGLEKEEAKDVTFDTSKVDVNKVGEYKATATYKKKNYSFTVKVEDTRAPMFDLGRRYVFTNDASKVDLTSFTDGAYDASKFEAGLVRFEKVEGLKEMDDLAIKTIENSIVLPSDPETLKAIGTEEVPTEEGIYRSVLKAEDEHGNAVYEEVYVILDKTGALIEDVPDKEVTQEDVNAEPEVNPADYTITDKVDGKISADDIKCELSVRDEEKHEYIVTVSYTDRAGNESKAEFLITVKKAESNATANNSNGNGTSNSQPAGNGSGNNATTQQPQAPAQQPAHSSDLDGDGVITAEEESATINPDEQAVINAGYYNVIILPSGNYGVLVHDYDGAQILDDYLASLGLTGNVSGGYINADNNWYMYVATNIRPIDTSGNEW